MSYDSIPTTVLSHKDEDSSYKAKITAQESDQCGCTSIFCQNTCSTCAQTCAANCVQTTPSTTPTAATPVIGAPLANSTAGDPAVQEQNASIPSDVIDNPSAYVYYNGTNMTWADFNQKFTGNALLAWVEVANNTWGLNVMLPIG